MNEADRDRMTTVLALVLIGVTFDDAVALNPAEAEALLSAWRDVSQKKAN